MPILTHTRTPCDFRNSAAHSAQEPLESLRDTRGVAPRFPGELSLRFNSYHLISSSTKIDDHFVTSFLVFDDRSSIDKISDFGLFFSTSKGSIFWSFFYSHHYFEFIIKVINHHINIINFITLSSHIEIIKITKNSTFFDLFLTPRFLTIF